MVVVVRPRSKPLGQVCILVLGPVEGSVPFAKPGLRSAACDKGLGKHQSNPLFDG
jgi:hypothetical protein